MPTRTKNRLLLLLKTRGALTTKALAEALEISVPAVRRHLQSLGGAVASESASIGVGRPAQMWRLTPEAQHNFPDTHAELTVKILDSIEHSLGPAALARVIADRYEASAEAYQRRVAGAETLAGKLKGLVALRNEEGYMAQLEKMPDGWLLVENHCPICAAATRCQGFCANELQLFRSLLGASVQVERVEYLLEGGQRCAYAIRPQQKKTGQARVRGGARERRGGVERKHGREQRG